MQPTLIKGLHADYQPAIWDGTNTSGIRPIGPLVIVLCDQCASITTGGVELLSDYVERMNLASEQGTIVTYGVGAFLMHEDGSTWRDYKPQPGDRVYFEKYAGRLAMGKDGRTYRIMDYHSIAAVYEDGASLKPDGTANSPERQEAPAASEALSTER